MSTKNHIDDLDLSHRYLAAIVKSSDDAIIGSTAEGIITSWNAAARRLFGYKASEVLNKHLALIVPRDKTHAMARIIKKVQKRKSIHRSETVCIGKRKQLIHVALTISPITDGTGKIIHSVTIARDLTRRVRGIEARHKRERELLTFYKLSEIILSPLSLEESYYAIVQEICAATGFPIATIAIYDEARQVMVFRGLRGFPAKPSRTSVEVPVKKTISGIIMRTGKPIIESHILDRPEYRSKVMRWARAQTFIGYPMKFSGKIIGCLNLAHTETVEISENTVQWIESLANYVAVLTERKRAEEELRESREQLRELSRDTQFAIEEERKRIAREIHDQLGQELSLFQLELGLIQDQLLRTQKDLRSKLKSMSVLVDSSIRTVQRISSDLRPTLLDNLGLGAAVEWAVNEFQKRTRIKCQISLEPSDVKLDQERSTAIFRILQEALTNVLRHARATKVSVRLIKTDDAVVLTIRDNGIGIPRHRINDSKSVGLTGMRERVRPWEGKVNIRVEPRKGTEITTSIPMKP
jgi:PAS domain S-box-containing protein